MPCSFRILKQVEILAGRTVPSDYVKLAMEILHLKWNFPLDMLICQSYVKLPKGTCIPILELY